MKTPFLRLAAGLALVAASAVSAFAQSGQSTLDRIKARGHIVCGTSEGVPGFSLQDNKGI